MKIPEEDDTSFAYIHRLLDDSINIKYNECYILYPNYPINDPMKYDLQYSYKMR